MERKVGKNDYETCENNEAVINEEETGILSYLNKMIQIHGKSVHVKSDGDESYLCMDIELAAAFSLYFTFQGKLLETGINSMLIEGIKAKDSN